MRFKKKLKYNMTLSDQELIDEFKTVKDDIRIFQVDLNDKEDTTAKWFLALQAEIKLRKLKVN